MCNSQGSLVAGCQSSGTAESQLYEFSAAACHIPLPSTSSLRKQQAYSRMV